MKVNHKQKQNIPYKKLFLIVLLFLFICGCGRTPDSKSSDKDDGPDFDGEWKITETYTGCNESGADNLTIDIDQKGSDALFIIEDQSLECWIKGKALNCTGIFEYDNGSYQEYTELALKNAGEDVLEGEASWTFHATDGTICNGTSVISGQSTDAKAIPSLEEGAIKIKNNTDNSFELINIIPCDESSWGPNQMVNDDSLDPEEIYWINGVPPGCYNLRACRDSNVDDDTECIIYDNYIDVEVGKLSSVSLEVN